MNWKKIKDVLFFCFIWVLSLELIEYHADVWIVEMAGDLFGALGLMFLATERALREEE